jgi:hypothetical protein
MREVTYDGDTKSVKCPHCGQDIFLDIFIDYPTPSSIRVFETKEDLERVLEAEVECPT